MEEKSLPKVNTDRLWDWLTALSPILLMMLVNYRWQAAWAVVSATAGWLAVAVMWQWAQVMPCRLVSALLSGVLIACCLPSAAPLWLSALAGMIAATVAGVPALLNRWFPTLSLTCPVCFPALTGYMTVRFAFAAWFTAYTPPVMWTDVDVVASATPVSALGGDTAAVGLEWLFWGVKSGSMGGGPVPALLLGALFLLLRRRLHLLPVGGMLATIALCSQFIWRMPAYALLVGGTLLATMLLGDETFIRVGWKGQITAGVVAGIVTVLCRVWWRMDGSALGVLAACLLTPLLHLLYHAVERLVRFLWHKFVKCENKG